MLNVRMLFGTTNDATVEHTRNDYMAEIRNSGDAKYVTGIMLALSAIASDIISAYFAALDALLNKTEDPTIREKFAELVDTLMSTGVFTQADAEATATKKLGLDNLDKAANEAYAKALLDLREWSFWFNQAHLALRTITDEHAKKHGIKRLRSEDTIKKATGSGSFTQAKSHAAATAGLDDSFAIPVSPVKAS